MSRLVLGLNSRHPDASAVLMNEKGLVAAIAEERINRKKHCAGYPALAIKEVLRMAGASMSDVTDVAVARDPRANLGAKINYVLSNPVVGWGMVKARLFAKPTQNGTTAEDAEIAEVRRGLAHARFHAVEHHLAHVASTFFWSPYDKATAVTVDGSGDFATCMIARCEGKKISILRKCYIPESLGLFYSAVCNFLGFNKYGEEYKVMGLSAYGQDNFSEQMKVLVDYTPEHGIRLNVPYYRFFSGAEGKDMQVEVHAMVTGSGDIVLPRLWGDKFIDLFGPARERGQPVTQRDKDVAQSMQRHFEECYMKLIRDAVSKAGYRDVVLAGGCALNGVANGRVVTEGLVDNVYITPAAADDGASAGAASYVLHSVLGVDRLPAVEHAYWGTSWTDEQIEPNVTSSGLPFRKLSRPQLMETASDALSKGKIIGWFQGREEWGPRALGNRSILCHPGWPDMKAILNARVKNREPFRPFAPAVLEEQLGECFEGTHPVPFMNIVFKVQPKWRGLLSATTHEDATGRVQSVRRDQNETYYDLINAFYQKTGTPVLLNTSFNENEPIVHTPKHAVECFKRTRMDALGIGSFWIEKPPELATKGEAV